MYKGSVILTNEQQREVIELIIKYSSMDKEIIKNNIAHYITNSKYYRNSEQLANDLNLDVQAVYSWTKKKIGNKPSILTALQFCELLNIEIEELFKKI